MKRASSKSFLLDEAGAASVEYALIAVLIAVAIFTAVGAFGANLNRLFQVAVSVFP